MSQKASVLLLQSSHHNYIFSSSCVVHLLLRDGLPGTQMILHLNPHLFSLMSYMYMLISETSYLKEAWEYIYIYTNVYSLYICIYISIKSKSRKRQEKPNSSVVWYKIWWHPCFSFEQREWRRSKPRVAFLLG